MTFLLASTIASANHNLHFCLYGAYGATFVVRAFLALREKKFDEAREHLAHGMVYVLLAFL